MTRNPISREEGLCLLGLSVAMAILWQWLYPWQAAWGDEFTYIRFSETPFITGTAPWCYRLLTPLLVSFCPLPVAWGYRLVTALGTVGVFCGLYLVSRHLGCSKRYAAMIWILYALHPQGRYLAQHPGLVDPLSTFFIVLSCFAIAQKRERMLSTVLLLGLLNHEAALWMIGTVLSAYLIERPRFASTIRAAIVCTPALIAFGLTRFIFPLINDQAIRESIIRENFPEIAPPARFAESFIRYFLSREPVEGNWMAVFHPANLSGGVAVLIPLAVVGFYYASPRIKSLGVFWLLLTLTNLLIQARPEMMYLGYPVIISFIAVLFLRWASENPFIQTLLAAALLGGVYFVPNSWLMGLVVACGTIFIFATQAKSHNSPPRCLEDGDE